MLLPFCSSWRYDCDSLWHVVALSVLASVNYLIFHLCICSWDDSSSVSSGLSDTLDNIGTDDLNPSTYSGISSRKSKAAQVRIRSHLS